MFKLKICTENISNRNNLVLPVLLHFFYFQLTCPESFLVHIVRIKKFSRSRSISNTILAVNVVINKMPSKILYLCKSSYIVTWSISIALFNIVQSMYFITKDSVFCTDCIQVPYPCIHSSSIPCSLARVSGVSPQGFLFTPRILL